MASLFSLRTSTFHNQEIVRSWNLAKSGSRKLHSSNIYVKEQSFGCVKYIILQGYLSGSLSQKISVKCIPSEELGSVAATGNPDQNIIMMDCSIANRLRDELEFSRVNCLVWVLHESARSFSVAVQTLELAKNGPELASAWVGVDVHAWHKSIAYQVAIYALFKAAIEVEVFLSRKRSSNTSSVHEILSPITDFLGERIESQLNLRNPKLVQWFRTLELPRIAGMFIPLFKKWSVDYAGSGVAGNILAISCCTAVQKLGPGRVSCPLFSASVEDALVELMNLSERLVSVDKLHYLATEAGFEEDFLFQFGRKVLPSNSIEDVEFWIGLVQSKLSNAFHRENVIADKHTFHDKVQENSLATLGLFAYLGRETRLFLSEMGVKDLDEQTKDFLSYLECGSLLMHPEFSTLSEYQLFMEVVVNEIGWLDFYAAAASKFCVKRRSKQQPIQAEKEIILYTVLTVCYDIIAGFAHYSNSVQQPLDAKLLDFLLQSQSLLSVCLEDYWAAYDRTGGVQKFADRSASDPAASLISKGGMGSSILWEAKERPTDLIKKEKHHSGSRLNQATSSAVMDPVTLVKLDCSIAPKPLHENLLRKSTTKLLSASADIWMGTELLFTDVSDALGLLIKQLKGRRLTKRERKKMKRTLGDIATLVPITILMLIPVSAVGHAAMLAAIKKYIPSLIPSPYSSERLDLIKQLKRTKKKEVQARSSIENPSSKVVE
ncbi:uncharacterized protein LOC132052230 isoform X1 [Lycium ferocissimum]|uniref:uncharacterized protein LOC132052230 isoform X1 n=1 Tax=Lycium ferocissimum TaxID=112874 RepID=UPI002814FFC7|nr:uncharacterized protein LOC132052230 isoform X1 [Lycium ferocissimum]